MVKTGSTFVDLNTNTDRRDMVRWEGNNWLHNWTRPAAGRLPPARVPGGHSWQVLAPGTWQWRDALFTAQLFCFLLSFLSFHPVTHHPEKATLTDVLGERLAGRRRPRGTTSWPFWRKSAFSLKRGNGVFPLSSALRLQVCSLVWHCSLPLGDLHKATGTAGRRPGGLPPTLIPAYIPFNNQGRSRPPCSQHPPSLST